jgi:hypothetical protein
MVYCAGPGGRPECRAAGTEFLDLVHVAALAGRRGVDGMQHDARSGAAAVAAAVTGRLPAAPALLLCRTAARMSLRPVDYLAAAVFAVSVTLFATVVAVVIAGSVAWLVWWLLQNSGAL